jgi:hypothetical protein
MLSTVTRFHDRQRRASPLNAPVDWVRSLGRDGVIAYHSGEGWAIRVIRLGVYVPDDGTDRPVPPFSSLPAAKAWAGDRILAARLDARVAGCV